LSGDNGNASGNQGMKDSVSPSQTPTWMSNVCGRQARETKWNEGSVIRIS